MFGRLHCHGCGRRSQYPKGTREFQCDSCEATNFYDEKGEVTHPPEHIVDPYSYAAQSAQSTPSAHNTRSGRANQPPPAPRTFKTFTKPQEPEVPVRTDDIFCTRCLNNQRFYTESVANYLPDEDHPQYQEYEDKLDQYKEEMEKKYPMVCKKCAIKVQEKIHKADYYGKAYQTGAMTRNTLGRKGRSPVGQRDDWGKWGMRTLLRLLGLVVYAGLLAQVAWHMSGIVAAYLAPKLINEFDAPDLGAGFAFADCSAQLKIFHFDLACYQLFSTVIPYALLINLCMLWHHHGLKDWYDGTHRMEAINGQKEHLRIQVVLLLVRAIGWFKLSDPWFLADLSLHQQYATHGFMIVFMLLAQWVSERPIKAERWKLRGKMMPRPDEVDVFSETAGPAMEQYDRQPSSVNPFKLFAGNEKPFPIENLAPRPPRGYSNLNLPMNPPPSPPDSDEQFDEDAMDIDWQPDLRSRIPGAPVDRTFRQVNYEQRRPQLRSTYNHTNTQPLGWSSMRTELFSIDDRTRAEDERKRRETEERAKLKYEPPVEQSPFRGRLPQAPMSMERRLRNPPTQVQFKKQPLSEQKDFMQQMRSSFEHGRNFSPPRKEQNTAENTARRSAFDFDEDFSPIKNRAQGQLREDHTPAKARTKGNLDLHDSGWRLPGDYATATGLEDLFAGKGFTINDTSEGATTRESGRKIPLPPTWLVMMGLIGLLGAVVWNADPARKAICFWLIRQLGLEDVQV